MCETTDDILDFFDDIEAEYKRTLYIGRTSAVGVFMKDQSEFNVVDLCGNVWEWCSSTRNQNGKIVDSIHSHSGLPRILRGGAWNFSPDATRLASVGYNEPDVSKDYIGFRICVAPKLAE